MTLVRKIVLCWFNPASAVLLLVLFLKCCLATSSDVLAKYGRVDDELLPPETTSLQGKLQGMNMVTRLKRTYYGFKGIPYAEPPVGDLRFKAPVAAGNWAGTFNATNDSNLCPQIAANSVVGNEDCLYLHVYTPKLPASDTSALLPVMVYIFGGRFEIGNNNGFVPNFLLDKDVVYVAPNFRLGLLGYLTTGDETSPGNYGLKDIVLALQWIQDNIRYFGGDPDRVTLFGQSAGAMSVSMLALSDLTKGLFHRIITQSGTALNLEFTPTLEVLVNRTYELAEYFGCPTTSSILLINCLRGINMTQIIDTKSIFYIWKSFPDLLWFPSPEPDIEGALFTDTFANLFAAGKHHDVPWMCLVNQIEEDANTFRNDESLLESFLSDIDTALPYVLGYWSSVDDVTAHTNALKSYYLNDLTADGSELLTNISAMWSDAKFYYPAYHMLQQQLNSGTSPLYFTLFKYLGSFTNKTATTHGDEMSYLFARNDKYSDDDWSMVENMVELWTSFAIDGRPTIRGSNNTIIWEPYSALNNYLRIGNGYSDTTFGMEYDLYFERMQVWDKLHSSTSGNSRIQQQLLPILIYLTSLPALRQLQL